MHHRFTGMGNAIPRKVDPCVVDEDVSQGIAEGVVFVAEDEGAGGGRTCATEFECRGCSFDFYFVDGHFIVLLLYWVVVFCVLYFCVQCSGKEDCLFLFGNFPLIVRM